MSAVGIFTLSAGYRNIEKLGAPQSVLLTAAMASLKEGGVYDTMRPISGGGNRDFGSAAQSVTSENNPNNAGVVRSMARSDHCRCVSTPRCARLSWNVVSMDQRLTNQPRISMGVASRSVHRNACGSRTPVGSRTSTQRIGAAAIRGDTRPPFRSRSRECIVHRHTNMASTVGSNASSCPQDVGKLGQSPALLRWPSVLAGSPFRRRLKQTGVEP